MVKEALNSDRVNYLIWRYLQESNYKATAVSLQKEWNQEDPRKTFDPTEHVKHHTLVTILQKGLVYDDLERSIQEAQQVNATSSHGFFGPLLSPPTPPEQVDDEYENIRKRSTDQRDSEMRQTSPSKRPRLSNGHQNGFDAMDVDDHGDANGMQNGNGHAYPSPKENEEPQSPALVITNGPQAGLQMEKPTELISETFFLSPGDAGTTDTLFQILHCDWHPQDSSILAVAGNNPLIHFWCISRTPSLSDNSVHVNGASKTPHWTVEIDGKGNDRTVSAFAWSPSGNSFFVASDTEEDESATVTFFNSAGTASHSFNGFEPPITSPVWNSLGDMVLAFCPSASGGEPLIVMFSANHHVSATYALPPVNHDYLPKLVWTGDYEFMVCGGDIFRSFHYNTQDKKIEMTKKHELREEQNNITDIAYDTYSGLVATANAAGEIDIWDEAGERSRTIQAHSSSILSMVWQPLPAGTFFDPLSERLLASSGDDGVVNVWDARKDGKTKPTTSMDLSMDSAASSLAFTPDGAFLAGATGRRVLIWKADNLTVPRAFWERNSEQGWESPKSGVSSVEDDPLIKWDADGQKLAFAANSQLAIIRWRAISDNGSQSDKLLELRPHLSEV